jgi:predicted metal-dependent hydrolase
MTAQNDIIIEFINIGNAVKVTAVCAVSGKEVSIVGNPKASKRELETIAIRKLKYVLNKDKSQPIQRSGIIV